MLRRVHILLLVFGLLAVFALLFTMAYNGVMGPRLQSYVLRLRRCAYLSEALCDRHPGCQAYYEVADDAIRWPEFRECRNLPQELREDSPTVNLCRSTGGEWLRQKFGPYCSCVKAAKTWTVDKGCQ